MKSTKEVKEKDQTCHSSCVVFFPLSDYNYRVIISGSTSKITIFLHISYVQLWMESTVGSFYFSWKQATQGIKNIFRSHKWAFCSKQSIHNYSAWLLLKVGNEVLQSINHVRHTSGRITFSSLDSYLQICLECSRRSQFSQSIVMQTLAITSVIYHIELKNVIWEKSNLTALEILKKTPKFTVTNKKKVKLDDKFKSIQ